jgi:putative transposase
LSRAEPSRSLAIMAEQPVRKTERLRFGRVSLPGARYFVTACVQGREPVLAIEACLKRVLEGMNELALTGDWRLLAATIMPDHVHILFTLGDRLPLDRVIAKLKSRTRAPDAVWRWQANVFEHRLRADEDAEDYAFYIFMNPCRAGLIDVNAPWPGWVRGAESRWRFEEGVSVAGAFPAEWLDQVKEVAGRIQMGE